MAKLKAQIEHHSGIPLGGLGTGTVEIRPDGYFHEWQIFNRGAWAPQQPECCAKTPDPSMPPGALAFYLRAEQKGRPPVVRRLGLRTDQHDLYSFAWCKSPEAIEFDGRFPVARLRYVDRGLPVSVEATMFSPFVPHDTRTSGTPGFCIVFEITNKSRRPVSVSLAGMLANPVATGCADRKLVNTVRTEGGTTFLTMRTKLAPEEATCRATLGSLGMTVLGGENSWIAGDMDAFMGASGYMYWHPPHGIGRDTFLRRFRETGSLAQTGGDMAVEPPQDLRDMTDEQIDALSVAEASALIEQIARHPWIKSHVDRISRGDASVLAGPPGQQVFLKRMRVTLPWFMGAERNRGWGSAALASTVTVEPGETKQVRYTLGWHFPFHYSAKGPLLGHMYENWFGDAEDVNRLLASKFDAIRSAACGFGDALHDTTLAPELADAWAGQLTTMTKCTWWTKNGDFGVWEGLGCCGFHTTDITYQGSFGLLALFPELQKRQMEMGARFQRADGRVHHFFTPDLSQVDEGFDRVDMNQQFVLLTCRDYLWTGDREYLRRLWPGIVKAMDNTAQLDADGDGLPDRDTKRNTYDAWDFRGTPSYIASLWLSALLAAVRIAEDLGETGRAKQWREILGRAVPSFDRKLWNGEYYSLWVDGEQRDECCMTDQLDGEWFTELIGLGHTLPSERIRAALRAVLKYNFLSETGLINANYPPGARPTLSTWQNLQAEAPWTGIEYAIASMMFDFGLANEAVAVVRNIDLRYRRAGRYWSHVECGDHYYRAMSSWAILLGATGFKIDVPNATLTVAPAIGAKAVRAPWVSASGWGVFAQKRGRFELRCASGTVGFRTLRLNAPGKLSAVTVNGKKRAAKVWQADGATVVTLRQPVELSGGDVLVVQ